MEGKLSEYYFKFQEHLEVEIYKGIKKYDEATIIATLTENKKP